MDLLTKVAAAVGPAHSQWCEECALPRVLRLANHRDYNIRAVRRMGCLPLGIASSPLDHACIGCWRGRGAGQHQHKRPVGADMVLAGWVSRQCMHALPAVINRQQQCSLTLALPLAPCLQHSVSGLVQLASCLPLEARSGPLMSAFAELCADTVRGLPCLTRLAACMEGWNAPGCAHQECSSQLVVCAHLLHGPMSALLPTRLQPPSTPAGVVGAPGLRQRAVCAGPAPAPGGHARPPAAAVGGAGR